MCLESLIGHDICHQPLRFSNFALTVLKVLRSTGVCTYYFLGLVEEQSAVDAEARSALESLICMTFVTDHSETASAT
jgi:hypothetical protein